MAADMAAARPLKEAGAEEHPRVSPGIVLFFSVIAASWAAPLIRFTTAPALAISFWRLVFSCVFIGALLTVRREWSVLRGLSVQEWLVAGLAGVLLAGHFVSWIASVDLTSVAASVALVSTQPVWVGLMGFAALGERPTTRQCVGIAVAVLGAVWIGWGDLGATAPAPIRGDLLSLLGAVLVSAYYVIGRGLRRHITLWPYVMIVYGCATLTLLLGMLGSGLPLVGAYSGVDWLVFLGLAIGPMMIGHTGQNWALRYLPAHVVNLSMLGTPVGATLIVLVLPAIREVPPPAAVVGGMLILAGILLGMRRR